MSASSSPARQSRRTDDGHVASSALVGLKGTRDISAGVIVVSRVDHTRAINDKRTHGCTYKTERSVRAYMYAGDMI